MSNLHWSKVASISMSFILTLLSLCGVFILVTPDVTVPDGFLVVLGYAIFTIMCSITGKHKAAIVFGLGGITAYVASWLVILWLSRGQLVSWHGKPVGLVVIGFVFICGLLGAIVSFMIVRSAKK